MQSLKTMCRDMGCGRKGAMDIMAVGGGGGRAWGRASQRGRLDRPGRHFQSPFPPISIYSQNVEGFHQISRDFSEGLETPSRIG